MKDPEEVRMTHTAKLVTPAMTRSRAVPNHNGRPQARKVAMKPTMNSGWSIQAAGRTAKNGRHTAPGQCSWPVPTHAPSHTATGIAPKITKPHRKTSRMADPKSLRRSGRAGGGAVPAHSGQSRSE